MSFDVVSVSTRDGRLSNDDDVSLRTSTATTEAGTRQDIVDGGAVAHPPNLYDYNSTVTPLCLPMTTADLDLLVEQYSRDGLLVFESFLDEKQITAVQEAIVNLTHGKNTRFTSDIHAALRNGTIPNFTSGDKIPWIQYEAGTTITEDVDVHKVLSPETAGRVRKLMSFGGYESALDAVAHDTRLLNVVARLLGCTTLDEIELFQDMALLKPAGGGREKPWHQDKAYFDIGVEQKVVGCWIAVDEATCENGCLRMLRGGHLDGPVMHFPVRDYQICDANAPSVEAGNDVVAIPLPPGGLVVFDGLIPHGTPTNSSTEKRRALQFHWIRKGAPIVGASESGGRTQVFGGIVNGLSC